MAKRKTVDVSFVKEQVNYILSTMAGDSEGDARYRKGMMVMLENILFETGNYKGFQYLDENQVYCGCKPGIRPNIEDKFFDTDSTRVVYM